MYSIFIWITGINSALIHVVCGPHIQWLCLSEYWLCVACLHVCARRESGKGASKVKCALYRQLVHILHSCVSTVCISLLLWAKCADFVKHVNVKFRISGETSYSTSVIHYILYESAHISENIEIAFFGTLTARFFCLSTPIPYMPPLSLICDERENLQRPQ